MKNLAILFALTSLVVLFGCQQKPNAAYEIDVSFELSDETANAVTSQSYDGLRLVFFGFSSCPDICPATWCDKADQTIQHS